ncbi:MAG: IS1182-like element ISCc5 family transposase [Saprospiraceae bacterium]
MSLICGQDRQQIQLLCWDQFIDSENPVRLIDAFVDYFDLAQLGFIPRGVHLDGRPAFANSALLKLYIYGYLNRIRSSRQLAKACCCNVELFWLLQQVQPGYKTIANFRKDNQKGLRQLFIHFNHFLKGEGLFQTDTVAIDSVKIAAQNAKKNNYNIRKVKQHLDYIEAQTQGYLAQLDQEDEQEDLADSNWEIAQRLDELAQRQQKYIQLAEQLKQARLAGETQLSSTDPDARALPKKMNIVAVAYNVQTSVEADHKLIAGCEVTNKGDTNALSSIAIKTKRFLGHPSIRVLADKGYDTGVELKKCAEQNILTYVSPRQKDTSNKAAGFKKEDFVYQHDEDLYICPAGKALRSNGNWYNKSNNIERASYRVKVYKLPFHICNACPDKLSCAGAANLKNSKGRPIERSEYEPYLEDNRDRVRLNKELYKKRQQIVEHPFGTIKRQWGYDYTLLKTMTKVEAEVNLIFTCYNLRRAMSIFGIPELISRLKTAFLALLELRATLMTPGPAIGYSCQEQSERRIAA